MPKYFALELENIETTGNYTEKTRHVKAFVDHRSFINFTFLGRLFLCHLLLYVSCLYNNLCLDWCLYNQLIN